MNTLMSSSLSLPLSLLVLVERTFNFFYLQSSERLMTQLADRSWTKIHLAQLRYFFLSFFFFFFSFSAASLGNYYSPDEWRQSSNKKVRRQTGWGGGGGGGVGAV